MAFLVLPINNKSDKYSADIPEHHPFNKFAYTNKRAMENVILDITRQRPDESEDSKRQLIYIGSMGTRDSFNAYDLINDFKLVQDFYDIEGRGGRRVYHEVLWFEPEERIKMDGQKLVDIGYACCKEYFDSGFQSVFAIHFKDDRIHIHFAVNTVSFVDGKKFRSYMNDLKLREIKFSLIIEEIIKLYSNVEY